MTLLNNTYRLFGWYLHNYYALFYDLYFKFNYINIQTRCSVLVWGTSSTVHWYTWLMSEEHPYIWGVMLTQALWGSALWGSGAKWTSDRCRHCQEQFLPRQEWLTNDSFIYIWLCFVLMGGSSYTWRPCSGRVQLEGDAEQQQQVEVQGVGQARRHTETSITS